MHGGPRFERILPAQLESESGPDALASDVGQALIRRGGRREPPLHGRGQTSFTTGHTEIDESQGIGREQSPSPPRVFRDLVVNAAVTEDLWIGQRRK